MKAEELMIGDWVRVTNSDHLEHVQVDGILGNGIFTKEAEYESEEIDIKDLQPIPITPEILEKNGYTPHDDLVRRVVEWCSEDNRIFMSDWEYDINSNNHWYIHIDNEDMDTICTAEITYVHELQHLLRLCKIKKEIIL